MGKNNQKSGNNSQQFQIENINIGLSETDVREIIKSENELALKGAIILADEKASRRLREYADTFIPKLVKAELLSAFSEPSFQFLFKETLKTAMCSDRKADYEMLSELLIHKVEKKENYTVSASIEKAISEINNISEEALMCLTLVFAIITYEPLSKEISKGLEVLNTLYGKILNKMNIPTSVKWLENLEVTNCVRTTDIVGSKKLEDIFLERLDGYAVLGIKKNSENYDKTLELLKINNIPIDILIDNELNTEYVRLILASKSQIEKVHFFNPSKIQSQINVTDEQKKTLENIFDMYEKNENEINEIFKEMLYSNNNIKTIIEWWNKDIVKCSITITPIGRVIAYTNARRIDSTLPDLNL